MLINMEITLNNAETRNNYVSSVWEALIYLNLALKLEIVIQNRKKKTKS